MVWHAGRDDETSYAQPVPGGEPGGALDPAMAVVVLNPGVKSVSSREAMRRTVATSPFFDGWVTSTEQDVPAMLDRVAAGDLAGLGELAESNALRMHATMLGARPPVRYWTGQTLNVLDEVQALRADQVACWATMDAGPNVKVLCAAADLEQVAAALTKGAEGDQDRLVVVARPGPGLRVAGGVEVPGTHDGEVA